MLFWYIEKMKEITYMNQIRITDDIRPTKRKYPVNDKRNAYIYLLILPIRNMLSSVKHGLSLNTKLFIHENASEIIVCEMAVILWRGRWVKTSWRQRGW